MNLDLDFPDEALQCREVAFPLLVVTHFQLVDAFDAVVVFWSK